MVNRVILAGHCTRDTVRVATQGKPMAHMRIATNSVWRDAKGGGARVRPARQRRTLACRTRPEPDRGPQVTSLRDRPAQREAQQPGLVWSRPPAVAPRSVTSPCSPGHGPSVWPTARTGPQPSCTSSQITVTSGLNGRRPIRGLRGPGL